MLKQESDLSSILRLCYLTNPSQHKMKLLSFIDHIFQSYYICACMNYPIGMDGYNEIPILSNIGGAYQKAAMEYMDKDPSIKNLVESSDDDWGFICLYNMITFRPKTTITVIPTRYLSVFALIDPINFKSFWFNGNLESIESFEELGENLGIKIPHPIRSCRGFLNYLWNPYLSRNIFSM